VRKCFQTSEWLLRFILWQTLYQCLLRLQHARSRHDIYLLNHFKSACSPWSIWMDKFERNMTMPSQLRPTQQSQRLSCFLNPRPIYTEDVPGVAGRNPLFVLLRRVIVPGSARQLLGAIRQTKNRARLLLATYQCRLAF